MRKENSNAIQKLIGVFTKNGLKSKGEKNMVYLFREIKAGNYFSNQNILNTNDAYDVYGNKIYRHAIDNFILCTESVYPLIRLDTRKVSGKVYRLPVYLDYNKGVNVGMRWIIQVAREDIEKKFHIRLLKAVLDISENTGGVLKKKEELHKDGLKKKKFF